MFLKIKNLLFTQTAKDSAIVLSATLINVVAGGLFFIFVPRILGPADYGLFSVVILTTFALAAFANFGIDTGILRFFKAADSRTNQILKLALEAYLVIGIAIFIAGIFLSSLLANFLGQEVLEPLFRIAFSGLILILLTDFFVATLQARKQFLKASIVHVSSNIVRLSILFVAAYFFTVNLHFLTILFFAVYIISIIIGKGFVSFDFLSAKNHRLQIKSFFGFNFWIAASLAISSIPIDNYLLLMFAGATVTGIYAAPYKILTSLDQFAGNFSRVLAPRFVSFNTNSQAKEFVKKTIPIVLFICFGILMTVFAANPIINLLLGAQYTDSVLIFQIIAISYIFYFGNTIPVSLIIYYFGQSRTVFLITLMVKTVWAIFSFILIPIYQATGAALAHVIAAVVSLSLFTAYAVWRLQKK
ncbi:oligosaccharide flippase family protein [Candidatus Curtissbacteria bacterium]|nr:oligosaccharide flippase family protein [Candidatus Curtissbacteria bacterium]